jgi:hypothetical protein
VGGKKFDVPGLEPAQPFLRKLNPQYKPGDKTSKFELYPVTYGGIAYWCLYDLLGRFMSLISLAPKEATRDNFYMPLANTAIYEISLPHTLTNYFPNPDLKHASLDMG